MHLSYIIVDDDELDRLAMEAETRKYPFFSKGHSFANAIEAAEFITRFHPDVVFTDIEMPDVSGLEMIRKLCVQTPVSVFITSHPEFALDGFEVDAFDYLLKPVDAERFERCATRIKNFFTLKDKAGAFDSRLESGSIVIKQGYDKHRLLIADILYIEAMKDYIRIVTAAQQFLVLETLGRMAEKLKDANFARIHRSYLVNRDKISGVRSNKIITEKAELPVGKLYRAVLDSLL